MIISFVEPQYFNNFFICNKYFMLIQHSDKQPRSPESEGDIDLKGYATLCVKDTDCPKILTNAKKSGKSTAPLPSKSNLV